MAGKDGEAGIFGQYADAAGRSQTRNKPLAGRIGFVRQNLEQVTIGCSELAVGEDKRSQEAEAGDAKVHRRWRPTPLRAAAARPIATDERELL